MAKNKNQAAQETDAVSGKKPRKTVAGPIRDKERTKQRLIATVGKVLQKYTYAGLSITNIAKESGLNPKLIYLYFGNLEGLIEAYILEKDFWTGKLRSHILDLAENPKPISAEDTNDLFQLHFDSFLKDKSLQRVIHWEMGVKNKLLRKIADERENVSKGPLELITGQFEGGDVDIQATLAIILGGIYYLTLHAKNNGSTVSGIDINEDEGRQRIERTMQRLIFRDFEDAKKKKTPSGKK